MEPVWNRTADNRRQPTESRRAAEPLNRAPTATAGHHREPPTHTCHAGGRGFESRRSRLWNPCTRGGFAFPRPAVGRRRAGFWNAFGTARLGRLTADRHSPRRHDCRRYQATCEPSPDTGRAVGGGRSGCTRRTGGRTCGRGSAGFVSRRGRRSDRPFSLSRAPDGRLAGSTVVVVLTPVGRCSVTRRVVACSREPGLDSAEIAALLDASLPRTVLGDARPHEGDDFVFRSEAESAVARGGTCGAGATGRRRIVRASTAAGEAVSVSTTSATRSRAC